MQNGRNRNMRNRQPRPAGSLPSRSQQWASGAPRREPQGSHNAKRNYERYLAFTEKEAVGQKLDIVVPSQLRDNHWKGFHGAMSSGAAGGEGQFFDVPGLHKTGEVKTLRVQLHLLRDDRKAPFGAMAIFTGQQ